MALWCICGRAGSGKTTWLCQKIGEAMRNSRPSYLIVPDQYTLEAERELMGHLNADGLWNAEVLSISRLCERVLAQHPSVLRPMDRRGQAMAVSRMLLTLQEELPVYGRYTKSPQFAATLAGEIAEYKRFGISPEALAAAGGTRPHLMEIARVYQAYEAHLAGQYQDSEDKTDLCIDLIGQTDFLKGALVCIDGFEMLTKQVYRCLLYTSTDSGIYINSCSVGLDSEAAYNASKMHNVAGSVSYLLGALWALIRRRICKCELSIDDGPKQKQSNLLTAFCNGQYYGGGFRPVPSADPQDGWMDVLTVDKMGRLQAIPLLAKYKKGTHVGHKKTHICKAKKISLTSKQLLCINLDGEIMHSHTLNLSLIPQALLIAQSELITE